MNNQQSIITPRVILQLLLFIVVVPFLPLLISCRWGWWEAWVYAIISIAGFAISRVLAARRHPDLIAERAHSMQQENVKPWDKTIMAAYTAFLLLTPVVAGLDAGRFRWSAVPLAAKLLAWLGLALAGALIFWAITTNTYLSHMARIQDDRGQVVVTAGPYRYVRHPMYLGVILLFVCIPVALGSWWALLPGIAIGALFVLRTAKEDRMLWEELPGYREYARHVQYRLVPGIW
jgi:protein-S-isoprenylcysteine O-methyltransferase Ste14